MGSNEQIALEIYQQMLDALKDVEEKEAIITIVNTLIEENGLSPDNTESVSPLEAGRKQPETGSTPICCPTCGSTHVVKNGSAYGKPRYRCNECRSYFGVSTGRVSQGSATSNQAWDTFIEGMLCNDTLTILSEKCHISLATAHAWRMKLFNHVGNSVEGKILTGIIQEDEFYLPASFKGNKKSVANLGIEQDYTDMIPDYKKYGFRDHPHQRGSQDKKRGLSRDKVCIATAIDEDRNVIGKPIGRGTVSSEGLGYAFDTRLNNLAILVTDKSKGGIKFAQDSGLSHVALDSKTESRYGQFNLQMVNALHSIIAEKAHSRSSFATKNAELYIMWEAWKLVNKPKRLSEKVDILKSLMVPGKETATTKQVRNLEFPKILQPIAHN